MVKARIVGSTGDTGVELLRLLAQHPPVELTTITSRSAAVIFATPHAVSTGLDQVPVVP
jgi:N-acetyl-gamma-glutamylphosphate reductase